MAKTHRSATQSYMGQWVIILKSCKVATGRKMSYGRSS